MRGSQGGGARGDPLAVLTMRDTQTLPKGEIPKPLWAAVVDGACHCCHIPFCVQPNSANSTSSPRASPFPLQPC